MPKEIIIYCRKFMRNILFNRAQMAIEIAHPNSRNPSKKAIREKLSKVYKKDETAVVVYGLKTQFGGGKTTGFACVYDDLDSRKKYDQHFRLIRDGLADKVIKGRKATKELKTRVKKVKGIEKAKVRDSANKGK
ncbi:unnamed protein product [Moneuplotes crassus]|uniref:40S ribosomal protein S24 n=1 Tax=Euplotes crassus TaxID=5936 RepID=A0AAD2D5N1_EUPCR|nr:unnamed protein product [Moneuplotes crassus]CAI2380631.1 unnamed protein product [Moneuplotes crassus]|mmetsp:Transcript_7292/g.6817  ORF Transcript_7292/g.6817 Transcript_7292/m.6817 type:complete len:134 (-) Transcript_7292:39-440(-)|eukprot:CAMPEP_0196995068 /NCGR_PEP_ID=MMETSP1380-20130617/1253_1 /TAXON_ID=5936 /ORGANISM="Euplotes crassus, Strain CT5" /LENGTH=133 /DNA_ID=CAMNT_0042410635 /DNA_START=23 /DNA_END=424 /DNA_ORIENTATION=-